MNKTTQGAVLGRIRTTYPRLLRILVPMDFSGKSRQALRYAVPLAVRFSARIHLVHVLAPETRSPDRLRKARMDALRRLGRSAEILLPKSVRAETAVVSGRAADQILALATANDIDLIVLAIKTDGTKGRRPGTAETILRRATCPVMSIRRH